MKNILKRFLNKPTQLSAHEKKHILIASCAMIFINLGVFLFGYFNAAEGTFYNGLRALTHGDYTVYYSYINQIIDGNILLANNFSIEPQQHRILNIFWLATGIFARIFHLNEMWALLLIKIPLIFFAVYTLMHFTRLFFDKTNERLSALWFTLTASGVGTFAIPFLLDLRSTVRVGNMVWPTDYWVPEAITFLTLYHVPHSMLSYSLILWILIFTVKIYHADEHDSHKFLGIHLPRRIWLSISTGFIGLALFNFHPYHAISLNAIIGIYVLYRFLNNKSQWFSYLQNYFIWLSISSISVLYHYFLILFDNAIGARASQNITVSPPLVFILIGFGFLVLGAVYFLFHYIQKQPRQWLNNRFNNLDFLTIYLLTNASLIYFPISFQRRFLSTLHVPLALTTVIAAIIFINKRQKITSWLKDHTPLLALLFIMIFGLSNMTNVIRDVYLYHHQTNHFYLPNSVREITNWLKENNTENKNILTYHEAGTEKILNLSYWITAFTNQRTFKSHGHETIYFEEKKNLVNDLVTKNDRQLWEEFYNDYQIKFVILKNSSDRFYHNAANLNAVFETPEYTIYETP